MHEDEYDPVKAREYYLRTRELKGRSPVEKEEPTGIKAAALQKATTERTKRAIAKGTVEQEQRRKELEQKAEELKVRVEKLKQLIEVAIEEAKRRSGMSEDEINAAVSDKKKSTKEKAEGDDADKPKTAQEKKEAAEAAEEYREENKEPGEESRETTAADHLDNLESKVENAQKKIKQLSEKLEKIRALSSKDKTSKI